MFTKKITLFTALLAASALMLGACSDDDNNGNPLFSDPEPSRVQIVHASPDAPAVDIVLNNGGTPAVEDLSFPNSTGYVELSPGMYNVKVNAANTTTTVINADLNLDEDVNYTVFAIDSLSSIEPLVLVDDLTSPAAGMAHVRFVHLSPDAPSVDIAVTGGSVVFPNVDFRGYTAFTPLPAGTYNLEVRVAGTSTVALPLPGITLEAGNIYTVFAKGFLSGVDAEALGAQVIVNN